MTNTSPPPRRLAAAAAVLALLAAAPLTAQASAHGKMPHKMTASPTVYACKMCKAYYTPTAAKKMGYKDGMGHPLTKMNEAPVGYTDDSKMGGKM